MTQLLDVAMDALSKVIDPDLHRDIVSLGMVQDLTIENGIASFRFVLTTPACPLKDQFVQQCEAVLLPLSGIEKVKITWDARVPRGVHGNLNLPIQNIIAVASGKGGVGKSTVSTNLAVTLAEHGAKVGLMDADILGPNIPTMVGLGFARPRVVGVGDVQKMLPFEAYGVKVMSMGFLADPNSAMIWRGPMLHSAIRQFFTDVDWGQLDYMVVDLPPGTGDAQLSLAQSVPVTGAVIVSQPQAVAIEDARRAISMFEKLNVPILGVVENMAGEFFGVGGGEALATERNLPFLGRIPLGANVREGGDSGRPVAVADPNSPAGSAFGSIAQSIAQQVSIEVMRQPNVIPINIIG
jgi:ATP-binding protein involved in chromosome partitioning